MFLAILTLLTGLSLSAVAIYYSVLGLAAIFAAAPVPIYIMGTILEVSKLVTASWLKQNWKRTPAALKTYLVIAVAVLMLITSMGIFGFLSKAHSDQSLVSGDVQSKIAIYDEKIKTARENIDANRKALKQMDEAVDQVMARSSSETGANRAVAIRRAQQKERARLQSEIQAEQKAIVALGEERAPIAAQVRQVEAEVGPIKYIAKLIYGDDSDTNLLEKAVTWVIVVIVLVFDPLAVLLLLASQMSFQWIRQEKENGLMPPDETVTQDAINNPVNDPIESPTPTEPVKERQEPTFTPTPTEIVIEHVELPETTEFFDHAKNVAQQLDAGTYEPPANIIQTADLIAQEIVEDSKDDDTLDIIEAKRLWKESHPNDSLKNQRKLLDLGLISHLPWESEPYLKKKNLTYLEKVGKQQVKKEISKD
jgi:hypothetical protein